MQVGEDRANDGLGGKGDGLRGASGRKCACGNGAGTESAERSATRRVNGSVQHELSCLDLRLSQRGYFSLENRRLLARGLRRRLGLIKRAAFRIPTRPLLPSWQAYSYSRPSSRTSGYSAVHGRTNAVASSTVNRYMIVSLSTMVKRSVKSRVSSDPRKRISPVKLVVSMTSVSPSQWARESPFHWRTLAEGAGCCRARCGAYHAPSRLRSR